MPEPSPDRGLGVEPLGSPEVAALGRLARLASEVRLSVGGENARFLNALLEGYQAHGHTLSVCSVVAGIEAVLAEPERCARYPSLDVRDAWPTFATNDLPKVNR